MPPEIIPTGTNPPGHNPAGTSRAGTSPPGTSRAGTNGPEIIKVCGITSLADAIFAAQNGVTALGFVFHKGSPRCIRVDQAAMIAAVVPKDVLRVGLFVNETREQVENTARAARLDVVQLHGHESAEYCNALEGLRVWKAFHVREYFNPEMLEEYSCEAYLLDAASTDGTFGGTGRTFPWPVARDAKRYGKIIVAGGLDGENVAEAIRQVKPWGVDASSKLESKPGVKDSEKVRRYLEAAKSVE